MGLGAFIGLINNKLKSKSINVFFLILFVVLIWLGIYYLCYLFPMHADDFAYALIIGDSNYTKIDSLSDIISSQYNHYITWGGRSVVHFIDQLLIWSGEGIADLMNSIVFVIMGLFLYRIINKNRPENAFLFLIINIVLWFILPSFFDTVFWMTGCANYTWGTTIVLLFIYPYYLLIADDNKKRTSIWYKSILFFFCGIIAGWTNENIALSMIFLLTLFLAYLKYNKKEIPLWAIMGLVGACVGCAVMLLAPGNYVRSSIISTNIGLDQVSSFKLFKIRIYNLYSGGIKPFSIASLLYVLFLWGFLSRNNKKDKSKILFLSLSFFVAAIVGYVVLYPVPVIPLRAFYGINVFLLVSLGILYANTNLDQIPLRIINGVAFFILLIVFVNNFSSNYKDLKRFSDIGKSRECLVEEAKGRGQVDIVFPESLTYPAAKEFLFEDQTHPYNKMYAKYMGIRTIRLQKQPY